MKLSLPASVATYFDISNGMDIMHIIDCFTQDATVTDEGNTYCGHDAIQSWKRATKEKFEYTVEPINLFHDGDQVTVTANVVGNFSGSPVQLDHTFHLVDGKIKSLKIG